MKKIIYKTNEVAANQSSAMEFGNHFKNGKSMMNRVKFIIFMLFLSSISVYAQDVITLRTGEQIRARVTEISPSELRYKMFDNLGGPTRVISLAEVFAINYANGTREVFNPLTETNRPQQPVTQTTTVQQQVIQTSNLPTTTSATRKNAFGGNLLLAGNEIVLFGIGAKYQRFVTDRFRFEPSFSYYIPRRIWGVSVGLQDFSANVHIIVPLSDNVAWYSLAGLCIATARASIGGFSESETYFGINLGTGMDFRLSETLTLNFEAKVSLIDFNNIRGIFSGQVGLAHRF